MSTEQKIIDAMRGSDVPHWTTKLLAARTGVSAAKVRETVQSMRWSGKMQFDRLALAPSQMIDEEPVPAIKELVGGAASRFRFKVADEVSPAAIEAGAEMVSVPEIGAALAAPQGERAASLGHRFESVDRIIAEFAESARQADERRAGTLDRAPASPGEAVAIALGEEIEGAERAIKKNWPDIWWRVVQRARQTGERPGAVLAELVEIGLDSLLADAR